MAAVCWTTAGIVFLNATVCWTATEHDYRLQQTFRKVWYFQQINVNSAYIGETS